MSKFGEEIHALGFVARKRNSAQPVDSLGKETFRSAGEW
jgi:hypothetical protein